MRVRTARLTCLPRRTSNRRTFTRQTEGARPSSSVCSKRANITCSVEANQYIISSRRRSAGKADSINRHTANGQKPKHAAGTERLFFKRAELLYTTDRPRPCCLSCLLRRGFLIKNVINVTNGPSEERPLRTGAWWSSLISCIHDSQ